MEKETQVINVVVSDASAKVVKLVIKDMATGKDLAVAVDMGAGSITIVTP